MARDLPLDGRSERIERILAWQASGVAPVVPRPASTVMVLREGARGLEVFVLRRVASMAFAPSMYVFPGGGVDAVDHEAAVDDGLLRVVSGMGLTAEAGAAFVAAAVREVTEECGVVLEVGGLRPRAHWVTPEFEPRRFDTWIFAAALPEGQEAAGSTTESDHSRWTRPAALLDRLGAGEVAMMPPTRVSLEQLAAHDTVAGFLAEPPDLRVIVPELVQTPDGPVMRFPDH